MSYYPICRCTLSLRKSGFAREVNSRKASAAALISLLRLHLRSAAGTTGPALYRNMSVASCGSRSLSAEDDVDDTLPMSQLSSTQVMSRSIQAGMGTSLGISVDEILSLCRRFLRCQVEVRVEVYNLLTMLQIDYPSFRVVALRFLFTHLTSLILEERHNLSWARSASTSHVSATHQDVKTSPTVYHMDAKYFVIHPDKFVDCAVLPQESLSDLLLSVLSMCRPALATPDNILYPKRHQLFNAPTLSDSVPLSQWELREISFVKQNINSAADSCYDEDTFLNSTRALDLYDSSTFTARRVCEDSDSKEASHALLKVCLGIADTDLSELKVPIRVSAAGDGGLNSAEIFRTISLLEATHAAMVVAICLNDKIYIGSSSDVHATLNSQRISHIAALHRFTLLSHLCQRSQELTECLMTIRKNARGTLGQLRVMSPVLRFMHSFEAGIGDCIATGAVRPHLFQNDHGIASPVDCRGGLHLIISELQFAISILAGLNDADVRMCDPDGAPAAPGGNIGALSSSQEFDSHDAYTLKDIVAGDSIEYLESHILERILVVMESAMNLANIVLKSDFLEKRPLRREFSLDNGVQWWWWSWIAIRSLNKKLFALLLLDFRRHRTNVVEEEGIPKSKRMNNCILLSQNMSNLQMSSKALLCSMKLEYLLSRLMNVFDNSFCPQVSDLQPGTGLISMLDKAFATFGHSDRPTQSNRVVSIAAEADLTNYTQDQGVNVIWLQSLQLHLNRFNKLFINMHDNEKSKPECPAIVCMLAQLLDVANAAGSSVLNSATDLLFTLWSQKLNK
jgi:hypothetical protein